MESFDEIFKGVSNDYLRLRAKLYRERNKEKIAASAKLYREQNKEKIAASAKLYREQNKEKIAARRKLYREQKIQNYIQKYYLENFDVLNNALIYMRHF